MKIFILLILANLNLKETNFVLLLGKDISKASFMGEVENNLDKNIYTISKPEVLFLGKSIDQIVIMTDDRKKIQHLITFYPKTTGNEVLFKIISKHYGDDYDVMIVDKILSESSSLEKENEGSFKANLKQTTMSLKKGSIKDCNINHILWNKEKFKILLFFDTNRVQIHFVNKN